MVEDTESSQMWLSHRDKTLNFVVEHTQCTFSQQHLIESSNFSGSTIVQDISKNPLHRTSNSTHSLVPVLLLFIHLCSPEWCLELQTKGICGITINTKNSTIRSPCMLLKGFAYPCKYLDIMPRFAPSVPQLSIVSNLAMNFFMIVGIIYFKHLNKNGFHLHTYNNMPRQFTTMVHLYQIVGDSQMAL